VRFHPAPALVTPAEVSVPELRQLVRLLGAHLTVKITTEPGER